MAASGPHKDVARLLCAAALVVGCADAPDEDEPPAERRALVVAERWQAADLTADPLPEHQPEVIDCAPDAAYAELLGYEVDTGLCNYLSVAQPSLVALAPGDTLELLLIYYDLAAAEPAVAHAAIVIGGDVLWETELPIPSPAGVIEQTITVPQSYDEGSPVTFHLHNHGYNTYNLIELMVSP